MSAPSDGRSTFVHTISVVVPVYQGERSLAPFVEELLAFATPHTSPGGRRFEVAEIVLVHDCGPDRSDTTIRRLVAAHPVVRPVWLSRNYGQHPATLAGMASTGSHWIATMDEDGQFDPADLARLLDTALDEQAQLVYGTPSNPPPQGLLRNAASRMAKFLAIRVLSGGRLPRFTSYRLVQGELGRSVAAYVGSGVYLDVALSWVVGRTATCPVTARVQSGRPSGYSFRRLLSHFWQLVLTSGTRPLRLVSLLGGLMAAAGFVVAAVLVARRVANQISVEGWTSAAVLTLVIGGFTLFALGVIAEYVGVAVRMALGRPAYLITSDPASGPLGHDGDLAATPDEPAA